MKIRLNSTFFVDSEKAFGDHLKFVQKNVAIGVNSLFQELSISPSNQYLCEAIIQLHYKITILNWNSSIRKILG